MWRLLVGAPRSLSDRALFHRLSLVPFLAWVGLGADGLSSSAYGPEEAFRTLGEHTYLAGGRPRRGDGHHGAGDLGRIQPDHRGVPHGGGGYVVATKLLGARAGVVSGSALLVDDVLTINVSIAAAGDALFSFAPLAWQAAKLPLEIALILGLAGLSPRGRLERHEREIAAPRLHRDD